MDIAAMSERICNSYINIVTRSCQSTLNTGNFIGFYPSQKCTALRVKQILLTKLSNIWVFCFILVSKFIEFFGTESMVQKWYAIHANFHFWYIILRLVVRIRCVRLNNLTMQTFELSQNVFPEFAEFSNRNMYHHSKS